jgi:acetyl esterase/lipase
MSYFAKTHPIRVTRGMPYGHAIVDSTSNPRERELLLDVYEPATRASEPAPALVMAFGGAFHRGTREDDAFEVNGRTSTAIAEYCAEFARRGYVCFSIDYRLVQEDPDPGHTPAMGNPEAVPRSRVDEVRKLLGLPPASNLTLWAGMEGAIDDGAMALHWVHDNADHFGIDPARIAAGGWSAGARVMMHAAYAERAPAAAVVCLSGYMDPLDMQRYITGAPHEPAAFVSWGTADLDYVLAQGPRFRDHFRAVGLKHVWYELQGVTHFHPRTTPVARSDGKGATLEEAMAEFLQDALYG